jgi:type II secretory ATPase GspE/PulE/Tfp pilus assembly ATPase PilB-like protein
MRGVSQLQIDVAKGITYARAIREQMRQDPDVMMVSECMDPEVLQLVTQVAVTGHLVLTSLHTNSAPDVLRRVLDMGGEPYLLNRHLVGVLSQRLVRVVCSHCKEKYEPESWVRSALGIGKEIEFFRGVGCGKCHNMGYRGRQAIHELLELNDQLRDAIARNAPAAELTRIAVDSGMRTLKEDGLAKAAQGITTVDEVLRVSG